MEGRHERLCCEILQHYGLNNQLWQTVEELSELIQAIVKHDRYGTIDGVLEELADVEIMLTQIRIALTPEQLKRVDDITDMKLKRQISRIRSED